MSRRRVGPWLDFRPATVKQMRPAEQLELCASSWGFSCWLNLGLCSLAVRVRLQRAGPTVTQGDEDDGCHAAVSQERQPLQELLVGLNRVGARRLDILDPAQGERMREHEGLAMGA